MLTAVGGKIKPTLHLRTSSQKGPWGLLEISPKNSVKIVSKNMLPGCTAMGVGAPHDGAHGMVGKHQLSIDVGRRRRG